MALLPERQGPGRYWKGSHQSNVDRCLALDPSGNSDCRNVSASGASPPLVKLRLPDGHGCSANA
jgi:hypothetical protein